MKKLFITTFVVFFATIAQAAPPTRVSTYTPSALIESAAVTNNEDQIFNYLTAGVSVYEDLSIVNADISASANIQSDKLNLTSIAQGVSITSSGSLTNAGTTTLSGSTTVSGTFATTGTSNTIGNGGSDTLTLNVPGGMTLSAATTWTLTGALTFSGTIADLGTVTTADINGGTVDGATIGGTSAGAGTFTNLVANTNFTFASGSTVTTIKDEDDMSSDSATALATQQSIKAYVDANSTTQGEADDDSGTSGTGDTYGTVASVVKTITSGNAVFVMAKFTHGVGAGTKKFRIFDGTNAIDEATGIVSDAVTAGNEQVLFGIQTGLSGSTTFSVQATQASAGTFSVGNIDIVVIEIPG